MMESDQSQATHPMSTSCYFPLTVSWKLSVVSGSTAQLLDCQLSVVSCQRFPHE